MALSRTALGAWITAAVTAATLTGVVAAHGAPAVTGPAAAGSPAAAQQPSTASADERAARVRALAPSRAAEAVRDRRRASAAAQSTATPVAKPAAPRPAAPSLCTGAGWQQRRGQSALGSLKAGAERTGFRVEFKAARSGYMGLTHLQERRIEMFVRACGTQSDELLRHVMAHELGHAYDTTHMTAGSRRAWQLARGIPLTTPWYGCDGCTDFATPAGDFAEVYAQWARGSATNRSQLAGDVPAAALPQLAKQFFGA